MTSSVKLFHDMFSYFLLCKHYLYIHHITNIMDILLCKIIIQKSCISNHPKLSKELCIKSKQLYIKSKQLYIKLKEFFFFLKICLEQSILGLHCLPSTFWGCRFLLFATSLETKCDLLVHLKEISKKPCHFASFYLQVQVNFRDPTL